MSPLFPQWPAIAETLPGFQAVNWAGFCGSAGMPRDITQQLGDDLVAVLKEPEVVKALAAMGIEHAPQGPTEFGAFIKSEMKQFAAVVRPLASQK